MNSALTTAAALGVVALAWLAWRWIRRWRERPIFALFELDPNRYRLLGADIGQWTVSCRVRAHGVSGIPDAVFVRHRGREGFVGDYKSRPHRGKVYWRERYQMILYMGLLRDERRLKNVSGAIRYADRLVPIAFCEKTYQSLLGLRGEYHRACSSWTPPDPTPLHQRT